jgi:hypothetical protein
MLYVEVCRGITNCRNLLFPSTGRSTLKRFVFINQTRRLHISEDRCLHIELSETNDFIKIKLLLIRKLIRPGELSWYSDSLRAGRSGDRIPVAEGGDIRNRADTSWSPPSLLYNGYRVIPGGIRAATWR